MKKVTAKKSLPKAQTGGVKVKEAIGYNGDNVYHKNKALNFKKYKATTDGNVKSTKKSFPDKPSERAKKTTHSMDTTGYSKGKKDFKLVTASVDLINKEVYNAKPKVAVKNISRKDVKKVIGGMKSNIGNSKKK